MDISIMNTTVAASKVALIASSVHIPVKVTRAIWLLYQSRQFLLKVPVRYPVYQAMQSTGQRGSMLVWGTANPEGLKDSYRGVYLNAGDVRSMVDQVSDANFRGQSIPVKLEHSGGCLGRVVSAWESRGTLECVLEIDERLLEGSIGAEFVRSGVCKDLSLGYTVDMVQSKTGKVHSLRKKLNEISLVVKGARKKCNVHGISKR